MKQYRVEVLGPHGVRGGEGEVVAFPSGKPFAVLAYLAGTGDPASRDRLGQLFWPGSERRRQLQSVRQALWVIRRHLGEDVLVGNDPVGLDPARVSCDVRDLVAALDAGDVSRATVLWRGPPLADLDVADAAPFRAWVDDQTSRLQGRFLVLLTSAAAAAAEAGEWDAAVAWLDHAMRLEPYVLEHRLSRVDLLVRAGRDGEARRALAEARQRFADPEYAGELDRREAALGAPAPDAGAAEAEASPRAAFVGRSVELGRLNAAWATARRGDTRRALIRGPAGTGRTRLARELALRAERDGGAVAWVDVSPADRAMAWSTVATLVRRLLSMPGAAGVSDASDAILRRLVPSLARPGAQADPPTLPRGAPLADALADLVGAVAFEAPLLIVVDEAQWLDPRSWTLLGRVMEQLQADPVLFILTLCDDEMDRTARRSARWLAASPRAETVEVACLSVEDTAAWVASAVDLAGDEGDAVAADLWALTGGCPVLLAGAMEELAESGALVREGAAWRFIRRGPVTELLADGGRGLLRKRILSLSPDAQALLPVLAAARVPLSRRELETATGTGGARLGRAIEDGVRRRVLVRGGAGWVVASEPLAAAVLEMKPGRATGRRRRRRLTAVAAVAALVIAVVVGVLRTRGADPYGRGVIVLVSGDTVTELRPPSRAGGRWSVRTRPGAAPALQGRLLAPIRTTDEAFVWFAHVDAAGARFPVEVGPDGVREVARQPGRHVVMGDLSPDGRRVVYVVSASGGSGGAEVHVAPRRGGEGRPVLASAGVPSRPLWSRDGLLLAVPVWNSADSLHVVTPAGRVRSSYAFDWLGAVDWCRGGRLVVIARVAGVAGLHVVEPGGRPPRRVTEGVLPDSWVACSPGGGAALVLGVQDSVQAALLVDLETGDARRLPHPMGRETQVAWLPDRTPAVLVRLEVTATRHRLPVGAEARLEAMVVHSDGSRRNVHAEFASSDPGTAYVTPDGAVTGGRPGRATIVATYADTFRDSVEFVVDHSPRPVLWLSEDFADPDLRGRWQLYGQAGPAAASAGTALALAGGGVLLQPYVSGSGLTAELEYRLPQDSGEGMQIRFGLCGSARTLTEAEARAAAPGQAWDRRIAFAWSADGRGGSRHGEALALFGVDRAWVDVGDALLSGRWLHFAVQIHPDGHKSLVLDRRRVATSRLREPEHADREWRVCLRGAGDGAPVVVRNLRVWKGVVY
jgi:DNA-binding SARP family transcriptional activator